MAHGQCSLRYINFFNIFSFVIWFNQNLVVDFKSGDRCNSQRPAAEQAQFAGNLISYWGVARKAGTQTEGAGRCRSQTSQLRRDSPDNTLTMRSTLGGRAIKITAGVHGHVAKWRATVVAVSSELL